MSADKKAVAVQGSPDLALQAKETIGWLKEVAKNTKKAVKDDPKEAVKMMFKVETMSLRASQLRVNDIVKQANITQIGIQRELGAVLIKEGRKQGQGKDNDGLTLKDLGIDKMQSSRFKQLAEMPQYVFKRALEISNMPSTNLVLKEGSRYKQLKAVVDVVDGDAALLKKFVTEGYSAAQAEAEVSDDDEVDVTDGYVADDDDEDEDLVTVPGDMEANMSSLADSAETLIQVAEELEEDFAVMESIQRDDYMTGVNAVKQMAKAVSMLKATFKDAKEKIDD